MQQTCRTLSEKIPLPRCPLLTSSDSILFMGSCFANQLKRILLTRGFQCYDYNPGCFHTYSPLYEALKAAGELEFTKEDYWTVPGKGYQHPYRRCLFAESLEALQAEVVKRDASMQNAIVHAKVIVLTYTLNEVWVKRDNGLIASCNPGYAGGGGHGLMDVYVPSVDENRHNIIRTIDTLRKLNPQVKLILSVCPVSLGRTYQKKDHLIANQEGKSILRAAMTDLEHYFPAFELLMGRQDCLEEDGRHLTWTAMEWITDEFEKMFVSS